MYFLAIFTQEQYCKKKIKVFNKISILPLRKQVLKVNLSLVLNLRKQTAYNIPTFPAACITLFQRIGAPKSTRKWTLRGVSISWIPHKLLPELLVYQGGISTEQKKCLAGGGSKKGKYVHSFFAGYIKIMSGHFKCQICKLYHSQAEDTCQNRSNKSAQVQSSLGIYVCVCVCLCIYI